MPRALWKGSISFGLVTIPVSLYTATESRDVAFKMLDKRDFQPVHEERKNAEGKTVPWTDVVKGYEYSDNEYVVVSPEDLKRANVEATQTIDIQTFVDDGAIDVVYFDKPYYIEPTKQGRKAYALLRETLKREKKVGVAKLVIRTRQHIAALRPEGDVLVVELLRWAHEIRDWKTLDLPSSDLEKLDVSDAEVNMATQLVKSMTGKWEPEKFKDTYREDVMKMIEEKIESGQTHVITEAAPGEEERPAAQVVDIMSLLKRSIEQQGASTEKEAGGDGHRKEASEGSHRKKAAAGGGKKRA